MSAVVMQSAITQRATSSSELLARLLDEVSKIAESLDSSDSLTAVAARALREQDCDLDSDVAEVLENHVYPANARAKAAIEAATQLIERLKELQQGGES